MTFIKKHILAREPKGEITKMISLQKKKKISLNVEVSGIFLKMSF